ncbi:(2Fe-2S)-binding protein [Georgenia sp. 10Sc9-8]|uniref:(2Fe-2S)-binding protein n=1 Tax=Georgenia halotolerans TaxID=3028317 RepID=A0ABT5TYW4_9MICO|nr:(2Fe-2S)-binding protein [Georgenia halotolerans]
MTTERPSALVRATLTLEKTTALDRVADAVQPLADKLVADPRVRRVLHGRDMGHALHPVLTDVPIGAWLSAATLDLLGGEVSRPAAQRLVGLGVLSAVPTALAGWSEWAETDGPERRVGVVHATANVLGLTVYAGSWFARRAGWHRTGVLLGMKGLAVVGLGGFLGAHLSLARKVSTRHEAFDVDSGEPEGTADRTLDDVGELGAGGTA